MKSSKHSLGNVILRLGSFGSTSAITYARIRLRHLQKFRQKSFFILQMANKQLSSLVSFR